MRNLKQVISLIINALPWFYSLASGSVFVDEAGFNYEF